MIDVTLLVTIIFRLINFGILICLGVYCFVRYLLPSIKEQMAARDRLFNDLCVQEQSLESQKHEAQAMIYQDIQEYAVLKQKIIHWQQVCAHREAQRIQAHNEWQNQAQIRRQEQAACIAKTLINRTVLPRALEQIEHGLQSYYTESRDNQSIESIIHFMDTKKL